MAKFLFKGAEARPGLVTAYDTYPTASVLKKDGTRTTLGTNLVPDVTESPEITDSRSLRYMRVDPVWEEII